MTTTFYDNYVLVCSGNVLTCFFREFMMRTVLNIRTRFLGLKKKKKKKLCFPSQDCQLLHLPLWWTWMQKLRLNFLSIWWAVLTGYVVRRERDVLASSAMSLATFTGSQDRFSIITTNLSSEKLTSILVSCETSPTLHAVAKICADRNNGREVQKMQMFLSIRYE